MNRHLFGTTLSERPCYSRSYFATTPTRQKLTIHMDEPNVQGGENWRHDHPSRPHGIKFASSSPTDAQGNGATRNVELVIRLWNQVINGEQIGRPERSQRFLPVPATLALFLNGRRDQMHESDSITQALILLQTHAANPAERGIQNQS